MGQALAQVLPALAGVARAVDGDLAVGDVAVLGADEGEEEEGFGVVRVGGDGEAEVGGQAVLDGKLALSSGAVAVAGSGMALNSGCRQLGRAQLRSSLGASCRVSR